MAKPWEIVDLDPSENLRVCLRKIAQSRFQEAFSLESAVIKGDEREALHDMRVSLRRLRAALKIFRDCFPKKKLEVEDGALRKLIRSLGGVREHDVFIEVLLEYRNQLTQQQGKGIELLIAREENSRTALKRQVVRNLKLLRRSNYAESFNRFLKSSL